MTPAELLREAANRIDTAVQHAATSGHHYAGVTLIGEEWAALLTPQVAAPLAAWLRAEAEQQDGLCGDTCPGVTCVASRSLARSILREEP